MPVWCVDFLLCTSVSVFGVGVSVKVLKNFTVLKKGFEKWPQWFAGCAMHTWGKITKRWGTSPTRPHYVSFHIRKHSLTFSLRHPCGPSLQARLPNKPTLAESVWVRTQAFPSNHSQVMTRLLQAGPGDVPPALPTYQNQVTTPPWMQSVFLPLRIPQEIWHTSRPAEV